MLLLLILPIVASIIVAGVIIKLVIEKKYRKLETEVLKKLNFHNWNVASYFDEEIIVKSRKTLEKYDDIKFFKENKEKLVQAKNIIKSKGYVTTNS